MRLLIDSMILVMVLVILIGAVAYRHTSENQEVQLMAVREGLDEFQEKLEYHSALWMAKEDTIGNYPPQIMPDWFGDRLPRNSLIAGKRPWMDIAPAGDYNDQPPDPLATQGQAAFWYNPELGIVRARVPQQDTDRLTLELYNRVNGTSLTELLNDPAPERAPLAFNPNPITSGQHASPDRRTLGQVQAMDPSTDTPAPQATQDPPVEEAVPWWKRPRTPPAVQAEPAEKEQEPAPARKSLLSS